MAKRRDIAAANGEDALTGAAQTRRRAIEAAVDCLAETGYAQTTLQVIARRAGMSHGPLQYHFQSKLELMAAVAEHLMVRRVAFFSQPSIATKHKRVLLAHFFERIQAYCKETDFQAVIELEVAARGDAALREAIDGSTGSRRLFVRDTIQKTAAGQTGVDPAVVSAIMDLLNALAVGLAIGKGGGLTEARSRAVWRFLETLLLD
jgi:AcrR family transcriptional regulator